MKNRKFGLSFSQTTHWGFRQILIEKYKSFKFFSTFITLLFVILLIVKKKN